MPVTVTRNLMPGMTVTRGAQDKRADHDVAYFFAEGAANTALGIEEAITAAVTDAGGWGHKSKAYSASDGPRLHTATGTWLGNGQVFGPLTYARGAGDCQPKHASSTIGFIEAKGTVGAAIEELGSGHDCDFPGVNLFTLVKRRTATEHISMPCVWPTTRPVASSTQTINSVDYDIDGVIYPAYTLRFDGYQVEAFDGRHKTYYKGSINWTYLAGGWTSHRVYCVRWVPLPLQGDQTLPSSTLQISTNLVYQYPASVFPPISSVCPYCYGEGASG